MQSLALESPLSVLPLRFSAAGFADVLPCVLFLEAFCGHGQCGGNVRFLPGSRLAARGSRHDMLQIDLLILAFMAFSALTLLL